MKISKINLAIFVLLILQSTVAVVLASDYDNPGGYWPSVVRDELLWIDAMGVNYDELDSSVYDWNYVQDAITLEETWDFEEAYVAFYTTTNKAWIGFCSLSPDEESIYSYCAMTFNRDYTDEFSSNERQWVIEHEIGHCFGLGHYWGEEISLMYEYRSSPLCYHPSFSDREEVEDIYE